MISFLTKHLFAIIIITTALNANDERERNNKIKNINLENLKIFQICGIQHTKKLLCADNVTSLDEIVINKSPYTTENKVRMAYWADMLNRSYIAPLVIANSLRNSVAKYNNLQDLRVYTYEDLFEGDFIGEFTGKISLSCEQANYAHKSIMAPKSNPDTNFIIDALKYGNELRFIRKRHHLPNCKRLNILDKNGFGRIIYVASRDIYAEEELILEENLFTRNDFKIDNESHKIVEDQRKIQPNQDLQTKLQQTEESK